MHKHTDAKKFWSGKITFKTLLVFTYGRAVNSMKFHLSIYMEYNQPTLTRILHYEDTCTTNHNIESSTDINELYCAYFSHFTDRY